MDFQVKEARTSADIVAIQQLFWNYGASRGFDSVMGDFKTEIQQLPGKYDRPEGCLLLGLLDDIPVGCVAYQNLGSGFCEMKRLFVEPNYRGRGFGQILIEKIIQEAEKTDYHTMRLDTFAYYEAAVYHYQQLGFYEIPPYQKYNVDGVLFFEKKLKDAV